jgi:hypothetical protein
MHQDVLESGEITPVFLTLPLNERGGHINAPAAFHPGATRQETVCNLKLVMMCDESAPFDEMYGFSSCHYSKLCVTSLICTEHCDSYLS